MCQWMLLGCIEVRHRVDLRQRLLCTPSRLLLGCIEVVAGLSLAAFVFRGLLLACIEADAGSTPAALRFVSPALH